MFLGLVIVAMLVGALATSLGLAASMPVSAAILLYPAAGTSFLMAVAAVRLGRGVLKRHKVPVPAHAASLG